MGQVIPFPQRGKRGARTSRPTAVKMPAQNKLAKKFTILIVEDHGSLRDIVSIYLMRQGYHIRTAGNGQAALDILATEKIHILLLDLMLPAVDGFEVLRQLQEQKDKSSPYVIVVTALTAESEQERVLKLGGDEYLPKPFHLPHLLERIQAAENQLSKYIQL